MGTGGVYLPVWSQERLFFKFACKSVYFDAFLVSSNFWGQKDALTPVFIGGDCPPRPLIMGQAKTLLFNTGRWGHSAWNTKKILE